MTIEDIIIKHINEGGFAYNGFEQSEGGVGYFIAKNYHNKIPGTASPSDTTRNYTPEMKDEFLKLIYENDDAIIKVSDVNKNYTFSISSMEEATEHLSEYLFNISKYDYIPFIKINIKKDFN